MLYQYLAVVIVFFALLGCTKKSDTCLYQNPLEEIAWLKQKKTSFDMDMSPNIQTIDEYSYNGARVFKISVCGGCTDAMDEVFDCQGNKICEYGGIAGINTCQDFKKNSTHIRLLYNQ